MIRPIVAATLLAAPASAQIVLEGLIPVSALEGGPVLALGDDYDEASWLAGNAFAVSPDYERVGEVEDLLLDESGQIVGVVAEIGGFLGIGDRTVVIPTGDVRLTPLGDDDLRHAFVTRLDADALEALPEIDDDLFD